MCAPEFAGPLPSQSSDSRDATTWSRRGLLKGGAALSAGVALGISPVPGSSSLARAEIDTERIDALVTTLRRREFSEEHVDAAVALLATAGISVYRAPSDLIAYLPVQGTPSPLTLLRWQVRQMALEIAARGGALGSDLDALVPPQEGAPPPSYLVGGYVAAAETAGGEIARRLMGKKNWKRAPAHRYPAMVLALCGSDLAVDSALTAGAYVPPAPQTAAALRGAVAIEACSLIATYVEQVINAVFNALKVSEPSSGVGKVLASIWNFLVDLAQKGVEFALGLLTDAVLGTIKAIAGVIAIGSLVLSSLKAWAVSVQASPAETHFGVGAEAVQGEIRAHATNGGLDEWPSEIASCASLGGVSLPDLTPGGAKITWALAETPIDLVGVADKPGLLAEDGRATLIYLTNNETPEEAQGEPKEGLLTVTATVHRPDLEQLKNAIADITFAAIPGIVAKVLAPILGGKIKDIFSGLVALADMQGSASVTVIYHEKAPTPTPEPSKEATTALPPSGTSCPYGEWEVINFAEYAQGVAQAAGAPVSYVPAGGSSTITITSDKVFTWVFDDFSVVGAMDLGSTGMLNVLLTIAGEVTGTIEIEQNQIAVTKTSSSFAMHLMATLDGVDMGEQKVDPGMFGLANGALLTYECTATGMALQQPAVSSPVALYLEPA